MKNIVVAIDGSPSSWLALGWARELARAVKEPIFHLVHTLRIPYVAMGVGPGLPAETLRDEQIVAEALLERAAASLPGAKVELHTPRGLPAQGVLGVANEVEADLIAIGRRGLGRVASMFLGSVSTEVLHRARPPVLVVHDTPPRPVRNILVGVDGSQHSGRSLITAITWAGTAEVTGLHVMASAEEVDRYQSPVGVPLVNPASDAAAEIIYRTARDAWVPPALVTKQGAIGDAAEQLLLAYRSGKYDLCVVGSRSHAGAELLIGGVGERLLQLAPGPVLVVK